MKTEEERILPMKEYEAIWEIFNKCPNNQMRDVFIEEIETENLDAWIENKFKDKTMEYEKTILPDGSVIYDIVASGLRQRYSFSEI